MTHEPDLDADVAAVLGAIEDPEIGVGIVDLGLVYAARHDSAGIHVLMTATSRSCPLGEYMTEQARSRLHAAFPDVACVEVDLVWSPPWGPERMSRSARAQIASSR